MSSARHQGAGPAAGTALPPGLIDDAIDWAVRIDFNTPSAATRQAFEAWLSASADHAQAWARVQSLQDVFRRMPAKLALDTLQSPQVQREAGGPGRRQALRLLSLAGITGGAAWLVHGHTPWQRMLADASTAVGAQRTLQLADGSVIVLNTDTAISTVLGPARRDIVLHRGEILVTTGPDPQAASRRPFWVQTPFGSMQALGTRFTVRLDGQRARVSVQEGAVAMHPTGHGAVTVARPGDSWWLAPQGSTRAPTQGFAPDGWADGVLTGRNMRLTDVLAELSRHRPGRIWCDERVADLRLSGTFQLRDSDQALRFLAQTQPVRVTALTPWWIRVGPAAPR